MENNIIGAEPMAATAPSKNLELVIKAQLLKSQECKSSIKAKERKVLYIFSFLIFWYFFIKKKVQKKVVT